MKDVSRNDGRTVLFVSHNMAMMEELCHTGIFLKNGTTSDKLPIRSITQKYWGDISSLKEAHNLEDRKDRIGTGDVRFTGIQLLNADNREVAVFRQGETIKIKLDYKIAKEARDLEGIHFSVSLLDSAGTMLLNHSSDLIGKLYSIELLKQKNSITLSLPHFDFKEGEYFINIDCVYSYEFIDCIDYACEVSVINALSYNYVKPLRGGLLAVEGDWQLNG